MVSGLAAMPEEECGNRLSQRLSADLFEHLVQGKPVWAPFYTYHKIMAGLLDMYVLAGTRMLLNVVKAWPKWAGSDFWGGISDRAAPAHTAHRVRRHERSAGESRGRD
jgi:DUF1680 family protein